MATAEPVAKEEPNNSSDTRATTNDVEKLCSRNVSGNEAAQSRLSAFKSLGFLDRFLAVWIFLAMLVGILLGNFVDGVGPALQRGTFVGVSLPIGMLLRPFPNQFVGRVCVC
jgi:ACR3 family arsenite transporter